MSFAPKLRPLLIRSLLIIGLALSWEGLSGGFDPAIAPLNPALAGRPSSIIGELVGLFTSGTIWPHLAATGAEVLGGLGLGLLAGLSLGLLFAYSRGLDRTLTPFMNGINALPQLALAPLLVPLLGVGLAPKVTLSALMATCPIFYNVYQGVKEVPAPWLEALQLMGASRLQLIKMVVWPALTPWLLSGLRVSAGLALVGAVIGEFVGSTQGLGYLMLFAEGFLQTNRALAILLLLAAWGILADMVLRRLERRAGAWQGRQVIARVPLES